MQRKRRQYPCKINKPFRHDENFTIEGISFAWPQEDEVFGVQLETIRLNGVWTIEMAQSLCDAVAKLSNEVSENQAMRLQLNTLFLFHPLAPTPVRLHHRQKRLFLPKAHAWNVQQSLRPPHQLTKMFVPLPHIGIKHLPPTQTNLSIRPSRQKSSLTSSIMASR